MARARGWTAGRWDPRQTRIGKARLMVAHSSLVPSGNRFWQWATAAAYISHSHREKIMFFFSCEGPWASVTEREKGVGVEKMVELEYYNPNRI